MTMAHYEKAQLTILGQPDSAFFWAASPPRLFQELKRRLVLSVHQPIVGSYWSLERGAFGLLNSSA